MIATARVSAAERACELIRQRCGEKRSNSSNARTVDAVIDHTKDQEDLGDHKRGAAVNSDRMVVEGWKKVNGRCIQYMDGEEQERAKAGKTVQDKTELPHAPTIAGEFHQSWFLSRSQDAPYITAPARD